MKICLISNKIHLDDNYSKFVNSCDKVVRVNKMENFNSGLTGGRVDVCYLNPCKKYFRWGDEYTNRHLLKYAEMIFVGGTRWNINQFCSRYGIKQWRWLEAEKVDIKWTTFSIALKDLSIHYPKSTIYFLGDEKRVDRCPLGWHNNADEEDEFFNKLVQQNRLVPILGQKKYINK